MSAAGTRALVQTVLGAAGTPGLHQVTASLDALGGAVAQVAPAESAFVHRTSPYTVQYTATWTDPALPGARFDTVVRGMRAAMVPPGARGVRELLRRCAPGLAAGVLGHQLPPAARRQERRRPGRGVHLPAVRGSVTACDDSAMATPFRRPDPRGPTRPAAASWPVRRRCHLSGADRRGHSAARHRDVDVPGRRARRSSRRLDLGRDPRAAGVALRRRHPLRHHLVQARHVALGGVSVDDAPRGRRRRRRRRRTWCAWSHTGYTTNLPLADVTGGRPGWCGSTRARRCRSSTAARRGCWSRTCTSGSRAKWVAGLRLLDHDEPGFWETQRLPRPGRPLARAAVPGD